MTENSPFHTLVAMFTEAQSLYLNEVLGVNPAHFPVLEPAPVIKTSTVIMTGDLNAEEKALLQKILLSVRLDEYTHLTGHQDTAASHVLVFGGALTPGRHQLGSSVWWSVPPLQSMLGNDHEVLEHKRFTWTLLQQMVKELK